MYSATDLAGFLECTHLANLERAAVWGHLMRPVRSDPVLDRIAQRGIEHERRFLESLHGDGVTVAEIQQDESLPRGERLIQGRDETFAAMRDGTDVIYQAVLFGDQRLGYADFLRRVERPSDLGEWGYEVWDTKLARCATASSVLQLCLYSDMVQEFQGRQGQRRCTWLSGECSARRSRSASPTMPLTTGSWRGSSKRSSTVGPRFPSRQSQILLSTVGCAVGGARCRKQWRVEDDLSPRCWPVVTSAARPADDQYYDPYWAC